MGPISRKSWRAKTERYELCPRASHLIQARLQGRAASACGCWSTNFVGLQYRSSLREGESDLGAQSRCGAAYHAEFGASCSTIAGGATDWTIPRCGCFNSSATWRTGGAEAVMPDKTWEAEVVDAIRLGRADLVKSLLDDDPKRIHLRMSFTVNWLHYACGNSTLEVVRLLYEQMALDANENHV